MANEWQPVAPGTSNPEAGSVKGVSLATQALLGISIAVSVASIVLVPLGSGGDPDAMSLGVAMGLMLVGGGQLCGTIATAVAFCMFLNRLHYVAKARGAELQHGPHAWGWFFVPFANLVKPRQVVLELMTALETEVPVNFWWGTWIGGNLLTNISVRISLSAPGSVADGLDVVSSIVMIVAAVAAIQVVRGLTEAAQRSEGRMAG